MQKIILEKPYQFVPPCHGRLWPRILRTLLPVYLRRCHGIASVEIQNSQRLKASLESGHGVMIAPNHSRPCDPMVLGILGQAVGSSFYIMASAHLFMESRLQKFILRRFGVFSVYREGMDREALKCAIDLLAKGTRPLVLFPEGVISRTNDKLNALMDGTAFIARNAAKERREKASKVVIHPVAIRYFFEGSLEKTVIPVIEDIERRLSWKPQRQLSVMERITKIGHALMSLKEIEYFQETRTGEIYSRLSALIDHLLVPLEKEWLHGPRQGDVVGRVKNLRTAILAEMIHGEISEEERARRWQHLSDLYLAQQLYFYPPDYFQPGVTPEKLLETVERFEEDLTDQVTLHAPIRALIRVGEALEVSPQRERGQQTDPVMARLRAELEGMMVREHAWN